MEQNIDGVIADRSDYGSLYNNTLFGTVAYIAAVLFYFI